MISRLLLLAALGAVASGQTFYNGVRGPRTMQIDSYVTVTTQDVTAVIVPKVFTKHYLVAAPFGFSRNNMQNKGVNLGYIVEREGRKTNAIVAAGIFRDEVGRYSVVTPQLYTTTELGRSTIDGQFALPYKFIETKRGGQMAITYGYGINERLRIGGSLIKEKGSKLTQQAIARFEIKKNHKLWLEMYLRTSDVGLRFVINH